MRQPRFIGPFVGPVSRPRLSAPFVGPVCRPRLSAPFLGLYLAWAPAKLASPVGGDCGVACFLIKWLKRASNQAQASRWPTDDALQIIPAIVWWFRRRALPRESDPQASKNPATIKDLKLGPFIVAKPLTIRKARNPINPINLL